MAVVIKVGKERNSVDMSFQALPCESRNRDCSLITVIRVLVDDRRNHGSIPIGAVFFLCSVLTDSGAYRTFVHELLSQG